MPHLNHSSPVVDPSLYGYGGQKRSLDEGGELVPHSKLTFIHHLFHMFTQFCLVVFRTSVFLSEYVFFPI